MYPSMHWAGRVYPSMHCGGVCPGGCLPGEGVAAKGCLPGGCLPRGVSAPVHAGIRPFVNRMTDACENITLPQLRCGR